MNKHVQQKVRIYPGFDILYDVFYLRGIVELFGEDAIHYTTEGFHGLDHKMSREYYDLAFIIDPPGLKIFIDHQDEIPFNLAGLAWCDIYGKINLDPSQMPLSAAAKTLAIGPHFPFRQYGLLASVQKSLQTRPPPERWRYCWKSHFSHWRRQYTSRLPYESYSPGITRPNYIFFSSTLWKPDYPCNQPRAAFIRACRSISWIQFEGGFGQKWTMRGYKDLIVPERPSHREFVSKSKLSTLVFNSPAVNECHGWKLGEFLALGKAIVSQPPLRAFPSPLIEGQHFHPVDGSQESIRAAVEKICCDHEYRRYLEQNARSYFLEHLQPRRVIERLVAKGLESKRLSSEIKPFAAVSAPEPNRHEPATIA